MLVVPPVALLIFNRPDLTAEVFQAIRRARPPVLLIVADGPRSDRPGEAEKCQAAREVVERVDWPCRVLRNYSAVNLGCGRRVSSGLDWVFREVEAAIILEDDCLPHASFFPYCAELLERYRDEPRVMTITGDNFLAGYRGSIDGSYLFSRFVQVWGWATWKRAWACYDFHMARWPELRRANWLGGVLESRSAVRYWEGIFERVHAGQIDTWDYQWMFATWLHHGLTATPHVNLVQNLGFRPDATHTRESTSLAALPVCPMRMPLQHPATIAGNQRADRYIQRHEYEGTLSQKIVQHVRGRWRGVLRRLGRTTG